MERNDRRRHWHIAVGLAATVCVALLGCPGLEGPQGPQGSQGTGGTQGPTGPEGPAGNDGPAGRPGLDAGGTLPHTIVNITDVSGESPVSVGGPIKVTFTLGDDAGDTIPLDELDRFSIYVSGLSDNYQRVIVPVTNLNTALANITTNDDGSYTYTFPDPFPSVYAAPNNDSAFYGPDDGELTGEDLLDGTYTVGIEARRTFSVEGADVRKAGDATFDFEIGNVDPAPRQLVLQENCEQCHVQLTLHGQNRFKVTGCVLCHINGAEDGMSSDPAKATTGVTIRFADMIHRIHRGAELPRVAATANSADPYRYEVIGRGESVHDYSDVKFPFMPGGTGFNQQMRNCQVCHGGAAQEEEIYADENIVQANCLSCHDDFDFGAGTVLDPADADVAAGNLTKAQLSNPTFRTTPGGITHTFDDGACVFCHGAGTTWDVQTIHVPVLSNPDNLVGLKVVVDSVTGNSGAGFFNVGDFPAITFNILDENDNEVDIAGINSLNLLLSGPVENYQRVFPVDGTASSTVALKGNGGVPTTGTGPFTYTSPVALPETYPPPFGDSAAFTYAGGWGELKGLALKEGSYTALIYAYRQFAIDGTNYRETSVPGVFAIRIGSAGTAEGYAGVVTDEKCNACHGDLRFHGNGRKSVLNCVMCHTAGAEDRPNVLQGQTQAPEPDTIDWKVMIHKIHAARDLSVVQEGGAYDLVGFASGQAFDTGSVSDFSTGLLPAMPGEAKTCTACHATDAWKEPAARDDVAIWKVVCTSCHDSAAVAVHVLLNTAPGGITEACAVCHGEGAAFSVEEAHANP